MLEHSELQKDTFSREAIEYGQVATSCGKGRVTVWSWSVIRANMSTREPIRARLWAPRRDLDLGSKKDKTQEIPRPSAVVPYRTQHTHTHGRLRVQTQSTDDEQTTARLKLPSEKSSLKEPVNT
ncbi:hypothetical protein CRM22_000444 [Opisthorchis felineus]|uniref:Uncharacterized protein n=1 Tax=Opisthorchis felineus TaxID=147828 RepID=A0A4S2MFF9_OPIFE|nr:hypothetical protein CRM22_000444 [Opisthorchis felineus]